MKDLFDFDTTDAADIDNSASLNDWECAETDRPRYLRWVWESSHLSWLYIMFCTNRDPWKLRIARGWKRFCEEDFNYNCWLEKRGNKFAWTAPHPTYESYGSMIKYARNSAYMEELIEGGTALMYEIGYYGISDEWKSNIQPD